MFTDPRSVVSRSVRPSLVLIVPLRTMDACCEPGSGGWVRAVSSGSLASAAQAGGVSGAKKKSIARTGNSATRRATEKGLGWKSASIVETISDRLLHFTRANLSQGSRAAQPHVTAGIPVLQLFQSANHAFHRLSLFR